MRYSDQFADRLAAGAVFLAAAWKNVNSEKNQWGFLFMQGKKREKNLIAIAQGIDSPEVRSVVFSVSENSTMFDKVFEKLNADGSRVDFVEDEIYASDLFGVDVTIQQQDGTEPNNRLKPVEINGTKVQESPYLNPNDFTVFTHRGTPVYRRDVLVSGKPGEVADMHLQLDPERISWETFVEMVNVDANAVLEKQK